MTGSNEEDECRLLHRLRDSEGIFDLLAAGSGEPELTLQDKLRRKYPDDVVRAAFALRELRQRARSKFTRADRMWFDRRGLEQATSEAVGLHKAQRFYGRVCDYCSGIGGNTIALATRCDVVAVDSNPAQVLRTKWNAEVYEVAARVAGICADVVTLPASQDLLHVDPDRRPGGRRRSARVEDCVPGIDYLRRAVREFRGGGIKLSPAGNFANKFADVEYELISLGSECKEAVVWFGALATPDLWRATVLPAGATLFGDPLEAVASVGELGGYLFDPDPAVVRAGLVDLLAERTGVHRLDRAEEYLSSDRLVESPFFQAFEVHAALPNNERAIRQHFRRAGIGSVEIKARHIPIQADAFRRRLPLEGSKSAVLIFARVAGRSRALVCRRIGKDDGASRGPR